MSSKKPLVFAGFQKTDLLNFPSHIASTVYTGGCNLKCPYCHNPVLVKNCSEEKYSEDYVIEYLEKYRSMIEALVVSGGEPTLQTGLCSFLERVKKLGLLIKLDTNGLLPEVLEKILRKNLLSYVALDIKLPVNSYKKLKASMALDIIEKSLSKTLSLLKDWGNDWEVRTTYLPAFISFDDIKKMVDFAGKVPIWYVQGFNPSVTLDEKWSSFKATDENELKNVVLFMQKLGVNALVR